MECNVKHILFDIFCRIATVGTAICLSLTHFLQEPTGGTFKFLWEIDSGRWILIGGLLLIIRGVGVKLLLRDQ